MVNKSNLNVTINRGHIVHVTVNVSRADTSVMVRKDTGVRVIKVHPIIILPAERLHKLKVSRKVRVKIKVKAFGVSIERDIRKETCRFLPSVKVRLRMEIPTIVDTNAVNLSLASDANQVPDKHITEVRGKASLKIKETCLLDILEKVCPLLGIADTTARKRARAAIDAIDISISGDTETDNLKGITGRLNKLAVTVGPTEVRGGHGLIIRLSIPACKRPHALFFLAFVSFLHLTPGAGA